MVDGKPNRVRLSERLFLLPSYRPSTEDFLTAQEEWTLDNALSLLSKVFPDFLSCIIGKEILDLGCGTGWQSVALSKGGAAFVLGLKTNSAAVEFAQVLDKRFQGPFDLVVSQNSIEHFAEPAQALEQMKLALKPDATGAGRISPGKMAATTHQKCSPADF